MNEQVAHWLEGLHEVLTNNRPMLQGDEIGDRERKAVLDALGRVSEDFRTSLYSQGLSGRKRGLAREDILASLGLTLEYFDQTIRLNKRDDGLYHAYNVLGISSQGISVERLQEMLEGQVAVLSSGALSAREALSVFEALRHSEMYRSDQHSYLLYPNKALPTFLEKNMIPRGQAERSELLQKLAADANTDLVEEDVEGNLHFNSLLRNIRDVRAALERLENEGYSDLVDRESELVNQIFESVFEHQRFTGRSGTFYGYEGLGCIYWHQVSKLLLAVQESCLAAAAGDDEAFNGLAEAYYDVRAGIGFNKSPEVYGAFPADPYSHTPGYAGAKQPGMTGQVKEEIITRLGELGLFVEDGQLHFRPLLLRQSEFLDGPQSFEYYDVDGKVQKLELEEGSLVFTYCQVPVVYRMSEESTITLHLPDGKTRTVDGLVLDEAWSREIFGRSGNITRLEVSLTPGLENQQA